MKCGNIREDLMAAVLSGPELASPAVQEHLASCETCALEVASLRQTMEMLDEWQTAEPSPYFSSRLRARMREDASQQAVGWLSWLRRPAVLTAAAALLAVGVGMVEGAHWKTQRDLEAAQKIQNEVTTTSAAVSDLLYLDNHADLFADFDALDDDQTETN